MQEPDAAKTEHASKLPVAATFVVLIPLPFLFPHFFLLLLQKAKVILHLTPSLRDRIVEDYRQITTQNMVCSSIHFLLWRSSSIVLAFALTATTQHFDNPQYPAPVCSSDEETESRLLVELLILGHLFHSAC
jgi:hypothetical protein